jgi:hypothetical protein
VTPFAFFAADDKPAFAEDLDVMRQGRLRYRKFFQQFTGTFFSACQQLDYLSLLSSPIALHIIAAFSVSILTPRIDIYRYDRLY